MSPAVSNQLNNKQLYKIASMDEKLKVCLCMNCMSFLLHIVEHYAFTAVEDEESDLHFTVKIVLYALCLTGGTSCSLLLQEAGLVDVDENFKQFCRFMFLIHLYTFMHHYSYTGMKHFAKHVVRKKCESWVTLNALSAILHIVLDHWTTLDEGVLLFLRAVLRLCCVLGGSFSSSTFVLYGYMEEDQEYKKFLRVVFALHAIIIACIFLVQQSKKSFLSPALRNAVQEEIPKKGHLRYIRF